MGDESNVASVSGSVEAAVTAMLVKNGASFYGNFIEVMVVIAAAVNFSSNSLFSSFLFYVLLIILCRPLLLMVMVGPLHLSA